MLCQQNVKNTDSQDVLHIRALQKHNNLYEIMAGFGASGCGAS